MADSSAKSWDFEAEGFRTTLHPMGEMIWILVAEKG